MAPLTYLDTHVVAWLYAGRVDAFPAAARNALNEDELLISPIVVLELQYLFELERVGDPAPVVVDALRREIGLEVCDLAFPDLIAAALPQSWTRDPFDRILVAQADARGAPLLTKDRTIRDHYGRAFWD